jgi:hypothetical protein
VQNKQNQGSNAEEEEPARKKKKKKLSHYDNAMLALGIHAPDIQNCAEVQLYASQKMPNGEFEQVPAGKVQINFVFYKTICLSSSKFCTRLFLFLFIYIIMTQVKMTIDLLHRSTADIMPAGPGREEPNTNPQLPDPEGRIDFTKMWNPFYFIK